ncbi:MAG: DUF1592 domain-containing protein [Nannocystaceae bacterium]
MRRAKATLTSGGRLALGVALASSSLLAPACGDPAGSEGGTETGGASSTSGDPGETSAGVDACAGIHVGPARVRRMTPLEYNNSVRDLLGDATAPADDFAPDPVLFGFDNNADAGAVSELLAEQMMAAAEALAAAAATDLAALLPCDPAAIGEVECGEAFLRAFGRRAYRRPLTDDELARLLGVFEVGRADGGFASGIELALQVILQSPSFLYRVEFGMPDPDAGPGIVRLDDHEIAARLSFLLWNSIPDPILDAAADAGELGSAEAIRAQAERMLADPRGESAVLDFHRQLLDLDGLALATKDPAEFPDFTESIRAAMAAETEAFVRHVFFDDDARLTTLLTADYSFLNSELANYYGMPGAAGPTFTRVDLTPQSRRIGLLTHGSLLTILGKFKGTAPVQRGKFVRQQLLCTVILPPPDVEFQPPTIDPDATVREKYLEHSVNPTCAGCHVAMDPIGFGFEHFDGVGRFRATENGFPVDASGEIVGAGAIDGPFDGVDELAHRLAESEEVRACVVRQWFRYAYGRERDDEDACALDGLTASFDADDDVRALLIALTQTDAFRYARAQGGEG